MFYSISDHPRVSIAGFYFFVEASDRFKGEVARLESPRIQGNGKPTCMVFYYHLYGQSVDTLRVKVGGQVLWEISGNQGNSWYNATVPLKFDGIYRVRNCKGTLGLDSRSVPHLVQSLIDNQEAILRIHLN